MPKFNKRKRANEHTVDNEEDTSAENSSINDEDLEDMVAAGVFTASNTAEDTTASTTTLSSSSSAKIKINLQRQQINDKPAILRALETVQKDLPWLERLEVVSAEPVIVDNIHDDLKVELAL